MTAKASFREAFPIVYAQEPARSVRFYCDLFGFEVVYRWPAEGDADGNPIQVTMRLEPA